MTTVHAENSQALQYQNNALQRLNASREEIALLTHLIQASMVVERKNPLRKAISQHWDLFRAVLITSTLFMSAAAGWLIPRLIDAA